MNDHEISNQPAALAAISVETQALGFKMASEPQTGSLLRTLAASKPHGRFLELGTGTGYGTAWILAGMDVGSRLESVENDLAVLAVAQRHLAHDRRVTFYHEDGAAFFAASAWPTIRFHLRGYLARQVHPFRGGVGSARPRWALPH